MMVKGKLLATHLSPSSLLHKRSAASEAAATAVVILMLDTYSLQPQPLLLCVGESWVPVRSVGPLDHSSSDSRVSRVRERERERKEEGKPCGSRRSAAALLRPSAPARAAAAAALATE